MDPSNLTESARYRGRFAPTPSGPLHRGSLVTALASYLEARVHHGEWLLRMDDGDPYRSRPGACDLIQRTLDALGLHWDGPITYQSRHLDRYQRGLEVLSQQNLLYACDCPRRVRLSMSMDQPSIYPGTCREKGLGFASGRHALRLRIDQAIIEGHDALKGPIRVNLKDAVGDLIVYRRDQVPAYHLATVLDDAAAGITHIVRGEDLLASTPGQMHLQALLGLQTPHYAHTPLVVDEKGSKLSKRTQADEAEIRNPAELLGRLLDHLAHPLPKDLVGASNDQILLWAQQHWSLDRLKGIGTIQIKTFRP